jgi:hypothetical protein
MSIALVVSRGFGNGTLTGVITKLVTVGFDISTVIPPVPPVVPISAGGLSFGVLGNGISTTGVIGNGINSKGSL